MLAASCLPRAAAQSEIPAGTRFLVELRDKLEAKKIKPGKKFEARTLEALRASDGRILSAGAKLKGRVSSVQHNKMMLRFEQIDTGRGKEPIIATVVGVAGEKDVRAKGNEGELQAAGHRGRDAAIGAAVLGGIGAALGATQDGGRGAAIGAGSGAAAGGLIGAAAGGKDLVLQSGSRLELQLDRPLTFKSR
ncbi:MAG: hypothetical protein ACRD2Y_10100 [Terriglobales bacterium]